MRFRNIFWGIILIVLGVLFTLENLNVIDFDWYNLWRLWPVILVLWGISILPTKNIIKSLLVILVLAASIYYMLDNNVRWERNRPLFFHNFHEEYDDDYNYSQVFAIPVNDSVKVAKLDMEVAASSFQLFDDSIDLIDFKKSGANFEYKYTIHQHDSVASMMLFLEDDIKVHRHNHNKIDMGISKVPVWDLSFDIGAAKTELDFSDIKVSNLDIEGGAANISVNLGDDYENTKVDIESGASSILIRIPEDSGCDLNVSSVLSGKNISGFEKIDHGHYQTSNFDSAKCKIYIHIETAVSSYSIIRY